MEKFDEELAIYFCHYFFAVSADHKPLLVEVFVIRWVFFVH